MKNSGLFAVCSIAALFAAAAFADSGQVTVCVPTLKEDLLSAEIFAAYENGAFKAEGLELSFKGMEEPEYIRGRTPAGSAAILKKVAGNSPECQFGASSIDMALQESEHFKSVRPLYFYLYGSSYDTHLVVKKGSKIKSIKDLKGKTVRAGQVATLMAMSHMLKQEGMTLSDIKLSPLIHSGDVLAALEKGTVDAAITYFPTMPLILASGKVEILEKNIFGKHLQPVLPLSFIAVNNEFAASNPEVIAKFTRALQKSDKMVRRNPSQLAVAFAKHTEVMGMPAWNLDPVVLERSNALFGDIHISRIGDKVEKVSVIESIEKFGALLKAYGYLEKPFDLSPWKALAGREYAAY